MVISGTQEGVGVAHGCQGGAKGSFPGRKKDVQMELYLEIRGRSLNKKNCHLLSTKFMSVF